MAFINAGDIYVESDTAHIKSIACKFLIEWGISVPFSDEWAHELCRYGGAEIHTVSAFMGMCIPLNCYIQQNSAA